MALADADVAAAFDAVDAGARIDCDGLVIAAADDGYALETPDLELSGLDDEALVDALETAGEYVTNWRYWTDSVEGEGTDRRAFLRWCERAPREAHGQDPGEDPLPVPARYEALREGVDREWGQLRITARLVDEDDPRGVRVYDCWHADDGDRDVDDLEVYEDPLAARDIATEDDDGRYRPLSTAPTLATGWAFVGLSGADLVRTVEHFYPATVANWHRERRGELDVDHWRETAERQTGIYDVVDELPREAVDWLAEACCVDSQCLRRREWEYEEGDDLAVDGGDGRFPCREPCSMVVSAARTFAIREGETERTWQLDLTTSELNQLAEIVEAVADGRTDEIREADFGDGANRYLARYLRAKRLDDEGSFEVREVE